MEDISFIYCDKCQSVINPTSAFVRLSDSYKRTVQQIKLDHVRELQTIKLQKEEEYETLKRKIEQCETRIRGEEKLHELLITDYEDKIIDLNRELLAEKDRVSELQDVEDTIKDFQRAIDRMQETNTLHIEEIDELKKSDTERLTEIERLRKELAAKGDIDKLKEENDQLLSALSEKDTELSNIKDVRKALEERVSFYMKERDQFRDVLTLKVKENEELNERISKALLEIDRLNDDSVKRSKSVIENPKDWSELTLELEKQKRLIETRLKLSLEREKEEAIRQLKEEYERRMYEIRNGYRRNMYQIGTPLDQEFVRTNVGKLMAEHLKDGAQGLAKFVETILSESESRANYVCTNMDNLKFKYFDKKGKWNTDKGCIYLKKTLYPAIEDKCEQILSDLKNSNPRDDELVGAVMNTVAKVEKRDKLFHEDLIRYLAPLISKH